MAHKTTYRRKTEYMLKLEREYGKPVEHVLADLLNQHGTMEKVGEVLFVSKGTILDWCRFLKVKPTKVWVVEE